MAKLPELQDVTSDQQIAAPHISIDIATSLPDCRGKTITPNRFARHSWCAAAWYGRGR